MAVRQNLLLGLERTGTNFSFNPIHFRPVSAGIGILAGKKIAKSLIKKGGSPLVIGPNFCVTPREATEVLLSKKVRTVLVPSPWSVRFFQQELPGLSRKLTVWSSGVDSGFWSPREEENSKRTVLIYDKQFNSSLTETTAQTLAKIGLQSKIIRYGSYSSTLFKELLRESLALVWLGGAESQGIAQFESWSVNVPTLVYYKPAPLPFQVHYANIAGVIRPGEWSAAPYLTTENGAFWSEQRELEDICLDLLEEQTNFSPRDFILRSHTVEKSAINYINLLIKAHQDSEKA